VSWNEIWQEKEPFLQSFLQLVHSANAKEQGWVIDGWRCSGNRSGGNNGDYFPDSSSRDLLSRLKKSSLQHPLLIRNQNTTRRLKQREKKETSSVERNEQWIDPEEASLGSDYF